MPILYFINGINAIHRNLIRLLKVALQFDSPGYSRLWNKRRGTLIEFWAFFQWLRAY